MLQVPGVHLEPPDHIVHVALVFLVVDFTARQVLRFTIIARGAVFSDEEQLPDDFSQIIFHLLKIGSFFWILVPAAFYQGVHLRGHKGYLLQSATEAAGVNSPLILSLKPCQSSDRA